MSDNQGLVLSPLTSEPSSPPEGLIKNINGVIKNADNSGNFAPANLRYGSVSDLPNPLGEGEQFLVVEQNGTTLKRPGLFIGPPGGGVPMIVNGMTNFDIFIQPSVGSYDVDTRSGLWQLTGRDASKDNTGLYTLNLFDDNLYPGIVSGSGINASAQTVAMERDGNAGIYRVRVSVDENGEVIISVVDDTSTLVDPGRIRFRINVQYRI